jgi:hypothetical protein
LDGEEAAATADAGMTQVHHAERYQVDAYEVVLKYFLGRWHNH